MIIDSNIFYSKNIIAILFGIVCGYIIFSCVINKPQIRGPSASKVKSEKFLLNGKLYVMEPYVCKMD